jgi:hypothetical protein
VLSLRASRRAGREESGFTLMETLVAMVAGLAVAGAAFAILEVALHQTSRVTDVAQASQLGRTTMTAMIDELHSACLAPGFTPIQAGSSKEELRFINAYSSEATIPNASEAAIGGTGAFEHKITYAGGILTDYSYPSTSVGAWPKFTFSKEASPAGGTRLGEHISQTAVLNEKKEKVLVPIFQYYKYATKTSSAAENLAIGTLNPEPLAGKPLNAAEAQTAASVLISIRAAPSNGNEKVERDVDMSDQVTFAFSAPDSGSTIEAGPCE